VALRESAAHVNLPEELRITATGYPGRRAAYAGPHMRGTRVCGIAFVFWVGRVWAWLGVVGHVCK